VPRRSPLHAGNIEIAFRKPETPVIAHVSTWAAWNYDALLQLLADNPDLTIDYPGSILYDATEAAELGEPGAVMALIDLKLSQNAQFRDKPGGCALAERAAKSGDEAAA
jgi:hypothetical protein